MKARIITIGDEILIGQVVDTNSAWLASTLHKHGIRIESIVSIADTREAIHKALDEVAGEVELVLMTGGLGPTNDDITKHALAEYFESDYREDAEVLKRVTELFERRGLPMQEVNRGQAMVPEKCEVLHNAVGTAPGMWFEAEGRVYVSMPGVPYEMKSIFADEVVPRIAERMTGRPVVHKTIMTQGIGETALMQIIGSWESSLQVLGLKLAYLPSPGAVRLRVSGEGDDRGELQALIDQQVGNVLPLISEYAYGFDDEDLAMVIGRMLKMQGKTLGVAESCTGGYLAHMITTVPGSSAYFKGGVIAYENAVKTALLQVSPTDLEQHGAVSEAVALQMAKGLRKLLSTVYAIATTGIAGPDGGTPEKPVGTVWIAVADEGGAEAMHYNMGNDRERNIHKTAMQGMQMLRKRMMDRG